MGLPLISTSQLTLISDVNLYVAVAQLPETDGNCQQSNSRSPEARDILEVLLLWCNFFSLSAL